MDLTKLMTKDNGDNLFIPIVAKQLALGTGDDDDNDDDNNDNGTNVQIYGDHIIVIE